MLTIETHGRVAVLNIDDGKANVVSEAFSKALNEGLDAAERDAKTLKGADPLASLYESTEYNDRG